MNYIIKRAAANPSLKGKWNENAWKKANVLAVDQFVPNPQSSKHRPKVEAKLTYRDDALFVFFRVEDRYVRAIRTDYQSSVCCDSCVEFFVQPKSTKGYFNFEVSCAGTMLLYYIEDPAVGPDGFLKYVQVPGRLGGQVTIHHSLPSFVYPEITDPTVWTIEYRVPFSLFEEYVGPIGKPSGQIWRANLYKCADQTSHPHWASWAPLDGHMSFHLPQYFAPIHFE